MASYHKQEKSSENNEEEGDSKEIWRKDHTHHLTWFTVTSPVGLWLETKTLGIFWAYNTLMMPVGSFVGWSAFPSANLFGKHKKQRCIHVFQLLYIDACLLTSVRLYAKLTQPEDLFRIQIFPNNLSSHRESLLSCDTGRCPRQVHSRQNHKWSFWRHTIKQYWMKRWPLLFLQNQIS